MVSAGIRIQFHYNQKPGIHFRSQSPDELFAKEIVRGLEDGMALRFPSFPITGSIWILEIQADEVDSTGKAFYQVARMAIDQAYSLATSKDQFYSKD